MLLISSPINRLPQELISDIFLYLDNIDLAKCSRVSTDWNKIANESRLWRQIHLEIPVFKRLNSSLISKLTRAQALNITSLSLGTRFDDFYSVKLMSRLEYPQLRKLDINCVYLQENGGDIGQLLAKLSDNLEELSLRQTLAPSKIFFMVNNMPKLQKLDLSYTDLDNIGISLLGTSFQCSSLKELHLDSIYKVTRFGMSIFLNRFTASNLQTLTLNDNQNLVFHSLKDFVQRHQGLALSIKGIDHFTKKCIKEIEQVGKCRSIEHTTILEDWTLEAIRRYVDYLVTADEGRNEQKR